MADLLLGSYLGRILSTDEAGRGGDIIICDTHGRSSQKHARYCGRCNTSSVRDKVGQAHVTGIPIHTQDQPGNVLTLLRPRACQFWRPHPATAIWAHKRVPTHDSEGACLGRAALYFQPQARPCASGDASEHRTRSCRDEMRI